MKTLADIGPLQGKKVLLRTDFDVPVGQDHRIMEEFRIRRQKECIAQLLDGGATVVMAAHITALESFEPLIVQLEHILGYQIVLVSDPGSLQGFIKTSGTLALLDNVRKFAGETDNSDSFATELAAGFDVFVNNAFAVCHRPHASIIGVPAHLPSFAGPLIVRETEALSAALDAPAESRIIIMGGAKASTKVPVIRELVVGAREILMGGVIATDVLKERGLDVGSSRVDEDAHELLSGIDVNDPRFVVPTDFVIDDGKFVDIGPKTVELFVSRIRGARTIIWNGPMGVFEDARFAAGTNAVAAAVAQSSAMTVIGGGDTIAAVDKLGLMDKFSFVSTGGGAMLAFLAGEELPGLVALGYTRTHPQ